MGTYLIKTRDGLNPEKQKEEIITAIQECGGQKTNLIATGVANTWSTELDWNVAKELVKKGCVSVVLSPNQDVPAET